MPSRFEKRLTDPDNRRTVYAQLPPSASRVPVLRTELGAGGRVPLARRADLVEVIEVLEGERILTVGDERRFAWRGDRVVVPPNRSFGIVEPQEGVDDGPFVFLSRLVRVEPPRGRARVGVRRIVALSRGAGGEIVEVLYDDGVLRSLPQAVEDAGRGLVQGVHAVRPRGGKPYLRVHPALRGEVSLGRLPLLEDGEEAWSGPVVAGSGRRG
jgi:hypothetical protein